MNFFSKDKIKWIFKRHPLLYYSRYLLLAKNFKGKNSDDVGCYNDINAPTDVPQIYFETSEKMALSPGMDAFDKAIAISTYLRTNIKGGPGLSLSSDKTLRLMLEGKGGVCNDFSQVFNNFCLINGIRVKEWNCVDRFFKTRFGHTFNEIYSPKHQKWIAIDVHQTFYFTPEDSDIPLSAVEIFKRGRDGQKKVFRFFVPGYEAKTLDRLNKIYAPTAMPFLTMNYRNSDIDHYLDRFRGKFPVFIISTILILLRKNFHFLFVLDNYKVKLLPKYFQGASAK